jgi:hypothetical protein
MSPNFEILVILKITRWWQLFGSIVTCKHPNNNKNITMYNEQQHSKSNNTITISLEGWMHTKVVHFLNHSAHFCKMPFLWTPIMNNKTSNWEFKLIMGPNFFCTTQDKKYLIFYGVFFCPIFWSPSILMSQNVSNFLELPYFKPLQL